MPTLEQLCREMQNKHTEVHSWQKVGDCYGINKATARLVANGYEPGKKVRRLLGLPEEARVNVVVIYGEVPPGAQVISAQLCIACRRAFIPNHPRRKRCFICSPFRRRVSAESVDGRHA